MRILLATLLALLCGAVQSAPVPSTYPLGATPVPAGDGGGVVFRVWAPNATSVNVPGQFNGWTTGADALASEGGNGIWSGWITSASEGDEFKYFLSGSLWRTDPRNFDAVHSADNSIVADAGEDYPWQATGWQTPDHEEMIIYELHIGTFSGDGDGVTNSPGTYRDVVDAHVSDLVSLGVNMVELLPIHEFAGDRSWGYNPGMFYAPESAYGDPDDLRYLVDTLHQNGIGVILDVVYNHAGVTDNSLWWFDGASNIYFYTDCASSTPWGDRPRYSSAEVRDYIADNAAHWLEAYRMDGLRVDATAFMYGFCNDAGEGWQLLQEIVNAARAVNPRTIIIAEELPNNASITTPQGSGGAGFDAQWGGTFHSALHTALSDIDGGGDPSMASVANAIAFSGFGRPNGEVVKYAESHDTTGDLNGGIRTPVRADSGNPNSTRARGLSLVAGGLTLLSPGIPMLMMGQEFLETKQFGADEADRISWSLASTPERDFFADLCAYRRQRPCLRADAGSNVYHVNDGPGAEVIAFSRSDGAGDEIVVIVNMGGVEFPSYQVGMPATGTWYEILNSEHVIYGGSGVVNGSATATAPGLHGQAAQIDIQLPPHTIAVFSQNPEVPVGLSAFHAE